MTDNYKYCLLIVFFIVSGILRGQTLNKVFIPLPPQELSVEQYLFHIENVTPFKLAYSSLIIENRRIALHTDSIRLTELLDTLFTKYEVKYILQGNQLILSPQPLTDKREDIIRLRGNVTNKRNDKAIPFVNVFIPGKSSGTITNAEGSFELMVPINNIPDSVFISCIGYRSVALRAKEFLTGPVDIKLQPYHMQIEELIIRPADPVELLRSAIGNKEKNYTSEPARLTAFFRETSKQNEKYISLSEAIIDIYKTSYFSGENDLVQLRKGRRGSNIEQSELVNLIVEGGLYNNIQLDIVKYGINFLDPEFFGHYNYSLEKQIMYNGRQTYIILFTFKEDTDIPGFNGRLFLDAKSLAVVCAEFDLSLKSLQRAHSLLVKKVPKGFRIMPKQGSYKVEYRFYDGKWNLYHARSELILKLRKSRQKETSGFTCTFAAASEFVITGHTTGDIERIKYRDASKPGDILYQQISETDLQFWGNETVILPEEPLLKTLEKLHISESKLVTKP